MTQNFNREHSPGTERSPEVWTEGARPLEEREAPHWEGRAPASSGASPHQLATRGFAESFGLHPGMATGVVATDMMVNAVEALTLGMLLLLSLLAAIPLGYITYKGQRNFYGDSHDAALCKALLVGLLSAIPGPLPYLLFVPAGIVGFFRRKP
jgi:hypothetical protein